MIPIQLYLILAWLQGLLRDWESSESCYFSSYIFSPNNYSYIYIYKILFFTYIYTPHGAIYVCVQGSILYDNILISKCSSKIPTFHIKWKIQSHVNSFSFGNMFQGKLLLMKIEHLNQCVWVNSLPYSWNSYVQMVMFVMWHYLLIYLIFCFLSAFLTQITSNLVSHTKW